MNKLLYLLVLLSLNISAQTIKNYIDNDWPDSRYIDHGDGTVTDTATSLMWIRCPYYHTSNGTPDISYDASSNTCTNSASEINWQAAIQVVHSTTSTFSYANHSDWRLPNIKELASLLASDRFDPAINITIFPSFAVDSSDKYWSSTPYAYNGNYSDIVEFSAHGRMTISSRHSNERVLFVRDAN